MSSLFLPNKSQIRIKKNLAEKIRQIEGDFCPAVLNCKQSLTIFGDFITEMNPSFATVNPQKPLIRRQKSLCLRNRFYCRVIFSEKIDMACIKVGLVFCVASWITLHTPSAHYRQLRVFGFRWCL